MSDFTFVIGTRPEVIKLFPLINELRMRNKVVTIVSTGQQRDLVAQSFQEFQLKPDIELNLMTHDQTVNDFFMRAQSALDKILRIEKPRYLCVHGDTSTAAAAALVGYLNGIPVAHIEAGLRSGNTLSPFPEEANRRIIDSVSQLHFAPTEQSFRTLTSEGHAKTAYPTGNTVVDSIAHAVQKPWKTGSNILNFISSSPFILVTQHRRENFETVLPEVIRAVKELVMSLGVKVIWPLHPNPNVRTKVVSQLSNIDNVLLLEPQGYFASIDLIRRAAVVVTDSGGIQEEAAILGIPLVITRRETERPEVLKLPNALLVGENYDLLKNFALKHLNSRENHLEFSFEDFGKVGVSSRITDILLANLD